LPAAAASSFFSCSRLLPSPPPLCCAVPARVTHPPPRFYFWKVRTVQLAPLPFTLTVVGTLNRSTNAHRSQPLSPMDGDTDFSCVKAPCSPAQKRCSPLLTLCAQLFPPSPPPASILGVSGFAFESRGHRGAPHPRGRHCPHACAVPPFSARALGAVARASRCAQLL